MRETKQDSFLGFMEERKLVISNREEMEEFIKGLTGEVMITIEEIKNRTQYQNNYYWNILRFMARYHPFDGYTVDELHSAMKQTFNVVSTKELNRDEFSEYLNIIIKLASEEDVQVPVKD